MARTKNCLQCDFFSTHREIGHRFAAPSLVRHWAQQGKIYLHVWEPANGRTVPKSWALSLFPHHWTGNQRRCWWHQNLISRDRNLELPNLKLRTSSWATQSVKPSWSDGVRILWEPMEHGTDITITGCTGEWRHRAPFPLTSHFFFILLNSLQDTSLRSFFILLQPTLSPGLITYWSSEATASFCIQHPPFLNTQRSSFHLLSCSFSCIL